MRKYYCGAMTLLLVAFGCHAELTDAQMAADCAKIADYASQGERAYKAKAYDKALEAFEEQAAWLEQCELGKDNPNDVLLATAYNNVALAWIRQGEYRKARAWLSIMPDDAKSKYNLARIQDKLQALPKPASAAGEYWQYAGRSQWEVITLKPQGGSNWLAEWSGYYFGLMGLYSGPNLGDFSEKVTLKNGKGEILLREEGISQCTISLHLDSDLQALTMQTDDATNCGFGHNVSADGTYLRVD